MIGRKPLELHSLFEPGSRERIPKPLHHGFHELSMASWGRIHRRRAVNSVAHRDRRISGIENYRPPRWAPPTGHRGGGGGPLVNSSMLARVPGPADWEEIARRSRRKRRCPPGQSRRRSAPWPVRRTSPYSGSRRGGHHRVHHRNAGADGRRCRSTTLTPVSLSLDQFS